MYSLAPLITLFFSVSSVCYMIVQLGNFRNHYTTRLRTYKKAKYYLKTEACANLRVKDQLDEFNLCRQAEEIMDKPPLFTAVVDTAEDMHICGNGYCSMLGINITNSLPQIFAVLGTVALLLVWASGVSLRQGRARNRESYFSLPLKKKDD